MGERTKPTPGPVAAEMERIKKLSRHHDGDAEDLISYARGITRLRSDLAAALSRAEKAEAEASRARAKERERAVRRIEEVKADAQARWPEDAPRRWLDFSLAATALDDARAALSTGEPTPRVERGASRP